MDNDDVRFMRAAIDIAGKARENGNHPFGALLVDHEGTIRLSAENTVITENDCTGHAETNLMRQASQQFSEDFLATCTLYSSTEPCAMCAGAIFWGNVRRVVYGLSEESLYEMVSDGVEEVLCLPCRSLFAMGRKRIEVVGPLLENEARSVHDGFWT